MIKLEKREEIEVAMKLGDEWLSCETMAKKGKR
jgi:hypothetical protein